MTRLDAKYESFITMLLSVSGKARPQDLQGISAAEAVDLLRQYAGVHAESSLGFEGDVLVAGVSAAQPAPAPVAVVPVAAAPVATDALPDYSFGPEPVGFDYSAQAAGFDAIPTPEQYAGQFMPGESVPGLGTPVPSKRKGLPVYLWVLLVVAAVIAALGIAYITGVLDPVIDDVLGVEGDAVPAASARSTRTTGTAETSGSAVATGSVDTTK